MNIYRWLWVSSACVLLATVNFAAASPQVDSSVIFVARAGHWQTDESHGSYRVVLWNQGYEHVTSGVMVEWIADAVEANENPRILFTKTVVEPTFYSFREPKIVQLKDRVRIILSGVNSYEPEQEISCSFDLAPGGVVSTTEPCA